MKKMKLKPRTSSGVFQRLGSFLTTLSVAYKIIEKEGEFLKDLPRIGNMVNKLVEMMDIMSIARVRPIDRDEALALCEEAELLLEQLEKEHGDNQSS